MDKVEDLIADIRAGKMVLLVDDEDRENEGDLVLAGQFATAKEINFMVREARGLVCLAMDSKQAERLGLSLMVGENDNHSPNQTAFTVSIEARVGISTGISAQDRATTIKVASDPQATPMSIISPGHIFPIKAKPGGVLQRSGHTEGSVDLVKLAGLYPSAAICEIMNDDGTMARLGELKDFAKKHDIKIGTIESIIEYRLRNEEHVRLMNEDSISIEGVGEFKVSYFRDYINDCVHYALSTGEWNEDSPVDVRVHIDRGPNDLLMDANEKSLKNYLKYIKEQQAGVLLVLRNSNFFSLTTESRDYKEFGIGAQILRALGAKKLNIISNSKKGLDGLTAFGVNINKVTPFSDFHQDNFKN